jgi:D-3-phosphoglycerate dehydrogenase
LRVFWVLSSYYLRGMKMVWLAAPISPAFHVWLNQRGYIVWNNTERPSDVLLLEGIITSNRLNLDEDLLRELPNVRWIARMGSGMEIIDTRYCASKGIACFSSPVGLANSVAEHATGMLLSLLHKIPTAYNEVLAGQWIREPNRGNELYGQCVGLIGYGHTGRAFAEKLQVFTPHIIAYDKYHPAPAGSIATAVSLEELQARADILSFHVPLNKETNDYYNVDFVAGMVKPHILINTSRGPVCASSAVLEALASGKLTGACLDVLDCEKSIETLLASPDNIVADLLRYNVIITPHIAGYSIQATQKMSDALMQQLDALLGGL